MAVSGKLVAFFAFFLSGARCSTDSVSPSSLALARALISETISPCLDEMALMELRLEQCVADLRALETFESANWMVQAGMEKKRRDLNSFRSMTNAAIDWFDQLCVLRTTLEKYTTTDASGPSVALISASSVQAVGSALAGVEALVSKLETFTCNDDFPINALRAAAANLLLDYGHLVGPTGAGNSMLENCSAFFKSFPGLVEFSQSLLRDLQLFTQAELPAFLLSDASSSEAWQSTNSKLEAFSVISEQISFWERVLLARRHPSTGELSDVLDQLCVQTALLEHTLLLLRLRGAAAVGAVQVIHRIASKAKNFPHQAVERLPARKAAILLFRRASLYASMVMYGLGEYDKAPVRAQLQSLGPLVRFAPLEDPQLLNQLTALTTDANTATASAHLQVMAVLALAVQTGSTSYEAALRATVSEQPGTTRSSRNEGEDAESYAKRLLKRRKPRCLTHAALLQAEITKILAEIPEEDELAKALTAKRETLDKERRITAAVHQIFDELMQIRTRLGELTSAERRHSGAKITVKEELELKHALFKLKTDVSEKLAVLKDSPRVEKLRTIIRQTLLNYAHLSLFTTNGGMSEVYFASFDDVVAEAESFVESLQEFQDLVPARVVASEDVQKVILSWRERIADHLMNLSQMTIAMAMRPDDSPLDQIFDQITVHVAALDHIAWMLAMPEGKAAREYCAQQLAKLAREFQVYKSMYPDSDRRTKDIKLRFGLSSLYSNLVDLSPSTGTDEVLESLKRQTSDLVSQLGELHFDPISPDMMEKLREAVADVSRGRPSPAELQKSYLRLKVLGMRAMAVGDADFRAEFERALRLAKLRVSDNSLRSRGAQHTPSV